MKKPLELSFFILMDGSFPSKGSDLKNKPSALPGYSAFHFFKERLRNQ